MREKQETGYPAATKSQIPDKSTLKKHNTDELSASASKRFRPLQGLLYLRPYIAQSLDFILVSFIAHQLCGVNKWSVWTYPYAFSAMQCWWGLWTRPTCTGLVQVCVHWLQSLLSVNVSGVPVTLCPLSSTQTSSMCKDAKGFLSLHWDISILENVSNLHALNTVLCLFDWFLEAPWCLIA